jgi:hypothetical protein
MKVSRRRMIPTSLQASTSLTARYAMVSMARNKRKVIR